MLRGAHPGRQGQLPRHHSRSHRRPGPARLRGAIKTRNEIPPASLLRLPSTNEDAMKKLLRRFLLMLAGSAATIVVGGFTHILLPVAQYFECRIGSCDEVWSITRFRTGTPDVWYSKWENPPSNQGFPVVELAKDSADIRNRMDVTVADEQFNIPYEVAKETHVIKDPKGVETTYNCKFTGQISRRWFKLRRTGGGTFSCDPDGGKWQWYANIETTPQSYPEAKQQSSGK